jgi:Xaa-Pro aminopeptidase
MASVYSPRVAALRRAAGRGGADSLLVTHLPNVLYLSGFTGSSGALLVGRGRPVLFTDGRYAIQARAEAPAATVVIQGGSLWGAVGHHLRAAKLKCAAFDPSHLSVTQAQELRRAAGKGVRWTPMPSVVEDLRSIKASEEIAVIRRAARLISRAFEDTLPMVKPGVREIELAAEIEFRIKILGASGPAFETIVASGKRAALPHARPTGKRLRKNELVVLDQGAILAHYCSDLTRTVFLGRAPSRIRMWYQAVGEAQAAAREALRPGATAGSVDAAARRVLAGYGLEKYFTHSLGHGIGLEIHEDPRLAKGQERRIEPGQVVTLEPGVYIEGVGGIRIEDDVAVRARGIEVLTNAPRELLEL